MDGKGMTAEQSPSPGDNGEHSETHARGANSPAPGNEQDVPTPSSPEGQAPRNPWGVPDEKSSEWQQPRVRVDARLLEATLLNLHKRIAAVPLVFDIPGADEVTAERAKLLSQIDDYLLPRVRQSAAPLLVALVGSTGAGKSTLVNSVVGAQVSLTGVRRPTTNSRCSRAIPMTSTGSRRTCSCRRCPGCARRGWPGRGATGCSCWPRAKG